MTELIERYLDAEKIKKIAIEKNYDEISFKEFVRFIDITLEKNLKCNSLEDDYENAILEFVDRYMDSFTTEREKGFSVAWSKEYAIQVLHENGEHAIANAYIAAEEHSTEQAQADLKLYCIITQRDELFDKHFKYLLEIDVPNTEIPIEKQAEEYSRIYKQQIENGKTEVFAHQYADLIAGKEFHQIYCEDYAFAYDKAIQEGKSAEYASTFADKYAGELVNIKRRAEIYDDEEMLDYTKEKVNAYMKGWEYAVENKIKNLNKFIEIYESIYLSTYFGDGGKPNMSIEAINKMITEKSMDKYVKLLNQHKD